MKRSTPFTFLLLLSFIALSQIDSKTLQLKLDSIFLKFKANEPGGCIHIQQGDQLLYTHSFGLANLETQQKFDEYTLSNIGDISRTFIAYEFQKLRQEGKLHYEDSLSIFYPDVKCKDQMNTLKLWHLLSHTSGIELKQTSTQGKASAPDLCAPLLYKPGSNYTYNPYAFDLIIPILETIAKQPWYDYIQQHMLAPSGMTFTKFTSHAYPAAAHAKAYGKQGDKLKEQNIKDLSVLNCANDQIMWSSIVDLRKYFNAIQYCLFLDCETINTTKTQVVPLNWAQYNSPPHGLVWKHETNSDPNKDSYFYYTSKIGSYCAYMAFVPSKNIQVIYLSNLTSAPVEPVMNTLMQMGVIER